MNKTSFWICDKCGGEITTVEDGWVEWIQVDQESIAKGSIAKGKGLRVVHRVKCIYSEKEQNKSGGYACDLGLAFYLTPNGLMDLLNYLEKDYFINKTECIELIKRLHIPGYEEARSYWDFALREGVLDPDEKNNYTQYNIQRVLEFKERYSQEY